MSKEKMKKASRYVNRLIVVMSIFFMLGLCTVVSADTAKVKSVDCGGHYTAILMTDDSLWMCGENSDGQFGNGTTFDSDIPVKVMTGVKDVSAGADYTAILKNDGSLWMCGFNNYGQLGDGTENTVHIKPFQVMTGVKAIDTGLCLTAALKDDDSLWMWGCNDFGTLGDGTSTDRYTPTLIMKDVKEFSTGEFHTAVVKKDGTIWMWGYNSHGEVISGEGSQKNPLIINISHILNIGNEAVKAVKCGSCTTAIILTDGSLWMCGANYDGQLGDGTTEDRNTPVKVMTGVKDVFFSRGGHTAILKTDGSLWMCGCNQYGELGDGSTTNRETPVKIMSGVKEVSGGLWHTAILKTDGSLWMCGCNLNGRLGDGTKTDRHTPVKISIPFNTTNNITQNNNNNINQNNNQANSSKTNSVKAPAKVKGVKATKKDNKTVTVKWSKVSGVSGYQISMSTKKKETKSKATVKAKTLKKELSASAGKTYYIKVRAFKTNDGKKLYGAWSAIKKYTHKKANTNTIKKNLNSSKNSLTDTIFGSKPKTPTGLKLVQIKNESRGTIVEASCDRASGVSGYEFQAYHKKAKIEWPNYSTNKSGRPKVYFNGCPGLKMSYKVRAYVENENGKKTYSSWSKVKTLTIKPIAKTKLKKRVTSSIKTLEQNYNILYKPTIKYYVELTDWKYNKEKNTTTITTEMIFYYSGEGEPGSGNNLFVTVSSGKGSFRLLNESVCKATYLGYGDVGEGDKKIKDLGLFQNHTNTCVAKLGLASNSKKGNKANLRWGYLTNNWEASGKITSFEIYGTYFTEYTKIETDWSKFWAAKGENAATVSDASFVGEYAYLPVTIS